MAGNDHKDGSWRVRDLFLSYGFVLVMALVLVIYSLTAHNFLALGNIMSILQDGSPLLIIASGASLVILAGRIDISVGSMAFLSACVGTMLIVQFHWPILPSVVAILLCGLVLGMLNGLIVVFLRVSPLITTLGTMIAFRGLALQLSNAQIIGLPGSLRSFGNARIGPLFVITLLALAVLLATHIMHTRTSLGRDITALGNGDEVASRLGIHVRKISFLVFAISGLLSGLAGLVSMCQVAALNSRLGSGMEFTGHCGDHHWRNKPVRGRGDHHSGVAARRVCVNHHRKWPQPALSVPVRLPVRSRGGDLSCHVRGFSEIQSPDSTEKNCGGQRVSDGTTPKGDDDERNWYSLRVLGT